MNLFSAIHESVTASQREGDAASKKAVPPSTHRKPLKETRQPLKETRKPLKEAREVSEEALSARAASELTEVDMDQRYKDMLDEVYSFSSVGGPFESMSPSAVLEEVDPTAYRCGFDDFTDAEDGETVESLDGGSTYYDKDELDTLRQEMQDELDAEEDAEDEDDEEDTESEEPEAPVKAPTAPSPR